MLSWPRKQPLKGYMQKNSEADKRYGQCSLSLWQIEEEM